MRVVVVPIASNSNIMMAQAAFAWTWDAAGLGTPSTAPMLLLNGIESTANGYETVVPSGVGKLRRSTEPNTNNNEPSEMRMTLGELLPIVSAKA